MSKFKLMIMFFLLILTLMGWSCNNWLMIWMSMEMSLIFFIGFMACEVNYKNSGLMMKYFIVQVFLSLSMGIFFMMFVFGSFSQTSFMVLLICLFKMSIFPFHSWLISIFGKMDWSSYLVMSTILKLIPALVIYYSMFFYSLEFFILVGSLVGSIMGTYNLSIQKLLGYSSISHMGWMIMSLMAGLSVFYHYTLSYFFMLFCLSFIFMKLNCFYINQIKINLSDLLSKFVVIFIIFSFAGLPPFMGFIMKWLVLISGMTHSFELLLVYMLIFSIITVYFYFHMIYYLIIVYSTDFKWFSLSGSFSGLLIFFIVFWIFACYVIW